MYILIKFMSFKSNHPPIGFSRIAITVTTAVLIALALQPAILGNLWSLTTGTGFFIPAESSMFTFRVSKENDGSGEWWLYGEDGSYYYCNLTDPYLAYPKSKAATCPNFNPVEVSTWCK